MSDASTSSKTLSSRERVPFIASDISALAKSLRATLALASETPSQVQMLNWLAKAAGHRNYQSLRAAASRGVVADASRPMAASVAAKRPTTIEAAHADLSAHTAKALTQFDADGRLHKWPHKFAVQRIAMWALWMRFDAKKRYTEKEVNSVLKAWHSYGDHVTLRRELVNMNLLARKSDCSEYWKVAQQPNDEVKAFLRALRATRA
jgi:hypothetical protein